MFSQVFVSSQDYKKFEKSKLETQKTTTKKHFLECFETLNNDVKSLKSFQNFEKFQNLPTWNSVYGVIPYWWTCTILWLNPSSLNTSSAARALFPSVWPQTTSRRVSWCSLHASRQHSFGLLWYVVNGSVVSVLISDVGVEYRYGGLVRQSACGNLAAFIEPHGWRSLDTGLVDVTTAGNGCSGMERLLVSRQLVTDAVERPGLLDQVNYLFLSVDDWDGWDENCWWILPKDQTRGVPRVLMECHECELVECHEFHSFVSPSVAPLSHCESFHCSCICMAQAQVFDPCLVTFVLFAPRVMHMSSMSAWPLTGTSTAHATDPFWLPSFDLVAELTLIW